MLFKRLIKIKIKIKSRLHYIDKNAYHRTKVDFIANEPCSGFQAATEDKAVVA